MAKVGAQRAATLTGKSKSTIQRAMDAGKLSFEVGENGRRTIDVSELERVFGLSEETAANDRKKPTSGMAGVAELERAQLRAKSLEDQMFLINQQLEEMKSQRDSWQKQAQQLAITHQVTQDQASSAKKEAEDAKDKVAKAEKDAEEAKREADSAKKELGELKQVAAKMKQRLVSQQQGRSAAASNTPTNKPKTILELLGFGGSRR